MGKHIKIFCLNISLEEITSEIWHRQKCNIKMDCTEIVYENVTLIDLAQDRIQ
jgi:hypothetical protein